MLASLTATFIQRHRVGAILAATVLQIAGFLVLFVAGVIDSDGLRIAAFAIAVIGALLAAAVMIFLAVARSARSAALRHASLDWLHHHRRCRTRGSPQSQSLGRRNA